ncbi:MAG: hypothetical protein KFF49_12835, partial [Bacteroidales bacterium]|nr:hypothetical protein [Bacteroidales bacterium]
SLSRIFDSRILEKALAFSGQSSTPQLFNLSTLQPFNFSTLQPFNFSTHFTYFIYLNNFVENNFYG